MIVVDAGVIVDALTRADGAEGLHEVMTGEELNAPALMDFEVVSALRGLTLGGHLTPGRAEDALTDFDDLPIRRWGSSDALRRRSFQLRSNVTAYDAAYVVLAEALECALVTRDARLAKASGQFFRVDLR